MNKKELDWFVVAIVSVIFIISFFLGFKPFDNTLIMKNNLGDCVFSFGFIVYGGAGLIRKRILVGAAGSLLQGGWAILASLIFLFIGVFVLYQYAMEIYI